MSRTPARIRQADVARALRAAKQAGAAQVRITPDGTILIDIQAPKFSGRNETEVAPEEEVVL
jgi:hypothetical protein